MLEEVQRSSISLRRICLDWKEELTMLVTPGLVGRRKAIFDAKSAGPLLGVKNIIMPGVTPLSLGIDTLGDKVFNFFPINTTLPASKSEIFSTVTDGQTEIRFNVVRGERAYARDTKTIASFILDGIHPSPRGVPRIEVTFEIDACGTLVVTAVDMDSGKKQNITITGATTLSTDEEWY